ncbi:MAG: Xaa-Pro peptidase family protein [bacterium]|nr:Xaa-Pro peptidase family protein [bacterium]
MSILIENIQKSLKKQSMDGWLFCSFHKNDPFAPRILKFTERGHGTRRWFYFIPAEGEPVRLVHAIEPSSLDDLEGRKEIYLSWQELHSRLESITAGCDVIAMQYSPMNDIPYVSCTDAGTVELIRSFGRKVVSSAGLVQEFEAILSEEQMETHKEACIILRRTVDEVFAETAERIRNKIRTDEYDIQKMITDRFKKHNLVTAELPVAAVNANSADPHYSPEKGKCLEVRKGDFLLIDLWAKKDMPHSVYGDITWTGFIGEEIPEKYIKVFSVAAEARDAAFNLVKKSFKENTPLCGWQVDDAARSVISKAGFGKYFIHRTGHSIGEEVHGSGVMIDNLETRDSRLITEGCCFSIEPGIYIPGDFGVRTEIDIFMGKEGPVCFSEPIQNNIIKIY